MNCKSFSKAGFALILILSIEHTNAQKVKPCSAVRMREHLFRNNPAAKKTFDSTQLVLKTKMQERTSQPNFPGAPYRIQTVVHVLGTTANTQPSDADIRTMIASINENLAGQDPDLINLPFAFTDNLAGNTGIELCLTDIDPNGFPTDGIIRHVTTRDDYYIEYGVNQVMSAADPAMGGIVIWDRNKYLNILITPTLFDTVGLPGQRVGVSSFPGYPANRDCYVVRRPNMLEDGAHTHELGHWLNLKHIWGDDDGDADATNDCNGSDDVGDTPNQSGNSQGRGSTCTFPQISCSNGPDGDMYMNYMDYSNCYSMFTAGQRDRMITALTSARPSIFNTNCQNQYLLLVGFLGGFVRVSETLDASGQVLTGSTLFLQAGQRITLKPGFRSDNGSSTRAFIKPCCTNQ